MLAGEIGKPHGVAGEVYVLLLSDDPGRFAAGDRLVHEDGRSLTVAQSRAHKGDRFLVKFEGVDSRDEAERLRGQIYAPTADKRELEPDEYWPLDLIGCSVQDRSGTSVGEVRAVVPGPAQDLLDLATPDGGRLVPLVKAIVVEVDLDHKRIVVDPPPGLLEG